jgi:hypothetical protein
MQRYYVSPYFPSNFPPLRALYEVGVEFCNWDIGSRFSEPRVWPGFAHERKTPNCSVDDAVMSTPGDWTSGCGRARGMKGEMVRGSISSERRTTSVTLGSSVGTSVGESIPTSSTEPTKSGSGRGDPLTLCWGWARENLGAVPSEQPTRGE